MSQKIIDIEAVFFDLDKTLYDQEEAWKIGLIEIKNEHTKFFDGVNREKLYDEFLKAEEEAHEKFLDGEPLEKAREERIRILLKRLGLEEIDASKCNEIFMNIYPKSQTPMEGAKTVVDKLSKNYSLGLITNGDREKQTYKLTAIGIKDYFKSLTFSEDIGKRKPDPEIFIKATKAIGIDPENSIYIGNSHRTDVCGANKVGMKTCLFNRKKKDTTELNPKPDYEIQSLDQILDFLTF